MCTQEVVYPALGDEYDARKAREEMAGEAMGPIPGELLSVQVSPLLLESVSLVLRV